MTVTTPPPELPVTPGEGHYICVLVAAGIVDGELMKQLGQGAIQLQSSVRWANVLAGPVPKAQLLHDLSLHPAGGFVKQAPMLAKVHDR